MAWIPRRTPLKRSGPPRKRRPGVRRGQPTKAEKDLVRNGAYLRAEGGCELDRHLHCCGGKFWPLTGELLNRGHLAHLRNKRMWGWDEQNVCWGCPHGHLDLIHTKGIQVPKTGEYALKSFKPYML
jgi:hypothetical protein